MRISNREIARAFAQGATKGVNNNGTIYIHGKTIYSYGPHWPMAVRVGNALHVNRDRYSPTTSKQTGYVAGAAAGAGLKLIDSDTKTLKSLAD
jgi:hypothetical protein